MELTTADYQNLLVLLDRVPVNGMREAQALVVLGEKLRLKIDPPPAPVKVSKSKEIKDA
jgi:hypothetical protein